MKNTSGPVTLYLDKPLLKVAQVFVAANPKEKSVSSMIERLLTRHLSGKVRNYNLRMPAHLAVK